MDIYDHVNSLHKFFMKIALPFKKEFPVTQKFGVPYDYNGKRLLHQGVDFGLPKGTSLHSPFNALVTRTTPERNTGYGKAVYLRSTEAKKQKIEVILAHCSEIIVEPDMKVKKGDLLAYSGRSGFWRGVNGYHLHYEIKINSKSVDPLPLISGEQENETASMFEDDSKAKSFLGSYEIKAGDTLWAISEKYYGNGGHYMEIYRVNEDILKSPHLIYPGQLLRIPALANKGV